MNKRHLQIGNLVSLNGQTVEVRAITGRKVGVLTDNECSRLHYARFHEIEPIQITEDWLIKNGFEKFFDDICESYHYYSKEIDGNYIDIKMNSSNISNDHVVCHVDNSDRCTIGCADIQYVHQLQNFLNLMGIKSVFEI